MIETIKGQAYFEQINNDLFWTYKGVTWQGYNDSFWWDNVSITDMFQVKQGYRLNPETDVVSLINSEENNE